MQHFIQLDLPEYDGEYLYNQVLSLNQIDINWHKKHNQICINTIPGRENDHLYGCGSLYYDWDNSTTVELENGDTQLHVPEREYKPEESEFTVFNSKFCGTVFEEIYNTLTEKYTLGRIRLMRSKPKTCLSWHNDTSKRIHLPIKTDIGCKMVIEEQVQHMPAGTWWLTDTTHPHTAFNSSKDSRIHLVACVL